MNEWIVAPLLPADPTARPLYHAGGNDTQVPDEEPEEQGGDRRGADRREPHEDTDDEFGRGEDRRAGLPVQAG
ncbi:MAG TPA: hypothetical protein DDX04_09520 [Massilia sp.]|nr:hypothetical protein [Massilia sp.]